MKALFMQEYVTDYLERFKINLKRKIESDDISIIDKQKYLQTLYCMFSVSTPVLFESKKRMTLNEERLDGYDKPTSDNPTMLSGWLRVTIYLPFEGTAHLFHCKPATCTAYALMAEIDEESKFLKMVYEVEERDKTKLLLKFNQDVDRIKQYLLALDGHVSTHNRWIEEKAQSFLSERITQLSKNALFVQSLGIPLIEDTQISRTYPISIKPQLVKINATIDSPEPIITQNSYERVLEIICSMSLAMERSPATFLKLKEPEIRDFFLIVLNSHFKGQATGETFNNQGKTDILIRDRNKNVFIGECKFWKGEQSFNRAINQILGYTSWRDTKTSILLFYKGERLTNVIKKIRITVAKHPNYEKTFELINKSLPKETALSYVFNNPLDKQRKLFLTIMVFPLGNKKSLID